MKILSLSMDFKPRLGGIAELAFQVCKELAVRSHHVDVMTPRYAGCPDYEITSGFTVHRIFDPRPPVSIYSLKGMFKIPAWSIRSRRSINQLINRVRPDIIFCTDPRDMWLPITRKAPYPFVLFMHGEDVSAALKRRNPIPRIILGKLMSNAAWTFFNSTNSLSLAKNAWHLERGSAVGCGFPVEDIVEEDKKKQAREQLGWDDSPVLLTVSRLVFRKGIDTTIAALQKVLQEVPNCRYVVVGDGPDRRELQALAERMDLDEKVRFLGRISEELKRQVYLAADLYVMPSRPGSMGEVEGFGISFLEANAYGLATIGSTVGGIPDAVEHGVNGLLVPPDDPSTLACAINELLKDPQRRREMALAGQRRIQEKFNWQKIVDSIEDKLKTVISG